MPQKYVKIYPMEDGPRSQYRGSVSHFVTFFLPPLPELHLKYIQVIEAITAHAAYPDLPQLILN